MAMIASQLLDISHFEVGGGSERIKTSNGTACGSAPADVECRALRCRHVKPVEPLEFVTQQKVVPRQDALRRSGVTPNQFDWPAVVDPLGAVHRRRRGTGYHCLPARPEPGADGALSQRRLDPFFQVHVRQDRAVVLAQLMPTDVPGGKRLSADEWLTTQTHAGMVAARTDTTVDSAPTEEKCEGDTPSAQSQRRR